MSRRIDAHQHFWKLDRGDYRWLTRDLAQLYRDFAPADLEPILRRHGIDATVVVQAADSVAETEYLLALADAHDFIAGVVGWVDLEARDAPDQLARLARHEKLVGIRPMIQDIPDERWMLRPALAPALRAVAELDLVFDALVEPVHLVHLLTLVGRHPDLRVVIDHGAKPCVAQGPSWSGFADWRNALRDLARHTTITAKLSGLVTEAGPDWTTADLIPFTDVLFDTFEAERLVWGSDWPVVELAGGHERWTSASNELARPLDARARTHLFGGNAEELYGLQRSTRT